MPQTNPELAELIKLSTLTLATAGADGQPHAAPVYFVADSELNFYFFSSPDSQHSRDVASRSRTAAAIHAEGWGWEDIRGVQMHGEVRVVAAGSEWDAAWNLYVEKFPFVSVLKDEVAQNQLYVFVPHWIRLVDNRKGFGFNLEWTLR